jgi:hypothetical protein
MRRDNSRRSDCACRRTPVDARAAWPRQVHWNVLLDALFVPSLLVAFPLKRTTGPVDNEFVTLNADVEGRLTPTQAWAVIRPIRALI